MDVGKLRSAIEDLIARAPASSTREEATRFHEAFRGAIAAHLAPILRAARDGHPPPIAELEELHRDLHDRVLALPYRGIIHFHHPFKLWSGFAQQITDIRIEHAIFVAGRAPCACAVQTSLNHTPPRSDRLELLYKVDDAPYDAFEVYKCGYCDQRWVSLDVSTEQYSDWQWVPFDAKVHARTTSCA